MPTFEQLYAYERKKWNKDIIEAQRSESKTAKAVVEESKGTAKKQDYSKITRSELFKVAKAEGWDKPWVESTLDAMVEYLA